MFGSIQYFTLNNDDKRFELCVIMIWSLIVVGYFDLMVTISDIAKKVLIKSVFCERNQAFHNYEYKKIKISKKMINWAFICL